MKIIIILHCLLLSTNVFAHGEDKLGPHKGYIRMPGSFHVELVPQNHNSYSVYILDLQNKNNLKKDSHIEMKLSDGKNSHTLNCKDNGDHFVCATDVAIEKGTASIVVTRSGNKANEAVYQLPLSLKEKSVHEGHNM